MNVKVAPSPYVVTAAQMQAIERRLFDNGMPVAALMEKVGQLLTHRIVDLFPRATYPCVSVLVGPGHNGGDALVVARELWEKGYRVQLHRPLQKSKELTQSHFDYAQHLGLNSALSREQWLQADFIIDGLFGFGLERTIEGELADLVTQINQHPMPVVSLDLPSGIHTDTGETLGVAISANHTFCLGLWKRAFFQEQALRSVGQVELVPFGIPDSDQQAVLGISPPIQIITPPDIKNLLARSPTAHKYEIGAVLLICGSAAYPGAAILTAQAARATGVGMLYVAVPSSIRDLVIAQVPDAVAIACPETQTGAIASLPSTVNLKKINAVAIGPGLTPDASAIVHQSLTWELPIVMDADALNILAQRDWLSLLQKRECSTVLTPHWGEFQRLFPEAAASLPAQRGDRLTLLAQNTLPSQITLLLKGAKTLISNTSIQINAESTPALARGGSGDVLTGLLAGLLAQHPQIPSTQVAAFAVWWHAQAARRAAHINSAAGVHPTQLIQTLIPYLQSLYAQEKNIHAQEKMRSI